MVYALLQGIQLPAETVAVSDLCFYLICDTALQTLIAVTYRIINH